MRIVENIFFYISINSLPYNIELDSWYLDYEFDTYIHIYVYKHESHTHTQKVCRHNGTEQHCFKLMTRAVTN